MHSKILIDFSHWAGTWAGYRLLWGLSRQQGIIAPDQKQLQAAICIPKFELTFQIGLMHSLGLADRIDEEEQFDAAMHKDEQGLFIALWTGLVHFLGLADRSDEEEQFDAAMRKHEQGLLIVLWTGFVHSLGAWPSRGRSCTRATQTS